MPADTSSCTLLANESPSPSPADRIPVALIALAERLLSEYELDHAVLTLRLQANLRGGCCGVVNADPAQAQALHALADRVAGCADAGTAMQSLQDLRRSNARDGR